MTVWQRVLAGAAGLGLSCVLVGCGIQVPVDPDGTLTDTTGGTIRAGYSPENGLIEGDSDNPKGPLAALVEGFADEIDADVEWSMHSEETIVGMLEEDGLDLGVGAFTDETPWTDKVGVTRAYPSVPDAEGHQMVMIAQMGENAFLSRLEAYLDQEAGS